MPESRGRVHFVVRRAHEPRFKVEINHAGEGLIDVSSYVLDEANFTKSTTEMVGTGNMTLDKDVLNAITDLNSNDEIKIHLNYTNPDEHVFTGIIENIGQQGDKISFDFADYGKLVVQRTYTGVFREDSATGNLIDIVKTILTVRFPELTYNDTTLPTTTDEFFRYAVQNTPCNEIFDYIAGILNRQWWIDKDKIFHMENREFVDSEQTITVGVNVIGNLLIATDVSRWANYVIVDGRTFLVGFQDGFSGDGVTTEFTLSAIPFDIEVKVGATGSEVYMTGSFVGAEGYTAVDYTIDQLDKTITFQIAAPASGDNILVDYRYMVKVHEELPDDASIGEFRRVEKYLPLGAVESQSDALTIAQNYLTLYSKPLKIYTARVPGSISIDIGKKVTLVDSGNSINKLVNIVGITHNFGTNGWTTDVQMVDFPAEFPDMYADLIARVRRLEELDKISGLYILNYLSYGSRIDIGIVANVYTQAINNSFVLDHTNNGLLGSGGSPQPILGDNRGAETLIVEDL